MNKHRATILSGLETKDYLYQDIFDYLKHSGLYSIQSDPYKFIADMVKENLIVVYYSERSGEDCIRSLSLKERIKRQRDGSL